MTPEQNQQLIWGTNRMLTECCCKHKLCKHVRQALLWEAQTTETMRHDPHYLPFRDAQYTSQHLHAERSRVSSLDYNVESSTWK